MRNLRHKKRLARNPRPQKENPEADTKPGSPSVPTERQLYWEYRKREQKRLDKRAAELAGPVTVTYLPRAVGGEQPVRASSADE